MYKTPRTLIENYLDVSQTQSVKMGRQGSSQRLVRTPEVPSSTRQKMMKRRVSRTPEPYMNYSASKSVPQHDRVSSLRGKRRSVSSSLDVVETPRQLLEGFLEGEDTTAPLVRYGSRILERVAASQPAIPVSRRSSQYRTSDSMIELDMETPRTLLQRYVTNTVDTVETPAFRRDQEMYLSPQIPVVQDTYSTPSPFKASLVDSDRDSVKPEISQRKTPRSERSRRGRFTMNVTGEQISMADESVIPPTNPADYQVPSPFRSSSSDEESFVPETPPIMAAHRSFKHKGNFNITVPRELQEEISRYSQSRRQNLENLTDRNSARHADLHSTGHADLHSTGHADLHSTGHADCHSTGHADLHSTGHDDIVYDSIEEMSDNVQEEMELDQPDNNVLPGVDEYMEYTLPLNNYSKSDSGGSDEEQNDDRRSSVGRHSLAAEDIQDFRNTSLDEERGFTRERNVSTKNDGRWSEGHRSRLVSPNTISDTRRKRLSEGSNRHNSNQMSLSDYFSPHRDNENSSHNESNTPNRRSYQSTRHSLAGNISPERRSSPIDVEAEGASSEEQDLYYAQRLAISRQGGPHDNIHTLGNISGKFSPMISSTQKSVAMVMDDNQEYDSPDAVTPSPNVSPVNSRRSSSLQTTPRNISQNSSVREKPSASKSESSSSLNLSKSRSARTPLRSLNMLTQVSPQGSVRSLGSRSSDRSRLRDVTARSPIVAGRQRVSDTVMTLPNSTMNFSPRVASTQNIALISGQKNLSQQEVVSASNEWLDEPDEIETANVGSQSRTELSINRKTSSVTQPKKKIVRKPRVKSQYSMPTNVVKKHFTHYAGMRVSSEAVEAVMKVSEKYWDILAKDLEAYAKHAGRKQINMSDFALLFKRQGHVTETRSLKSLIEKYLPMEEREKLIPVARAGNRIEPKL